jgi:hypothetical protein
LWLKVRDDVPPGKDVLLWTGGKAVVGSLMIHSRPDGTTSANFMDVLGNEILPWPVYWMRIPPPPAD